MSKLCLGTFFTAINVCVSENSFKQGEDFRNIFVLIDPDYDPSPDLVSKFVRGVRTPSKAFISTVNRYEPDQYNELCFCMNGIANKINAQNEILLVKTITKIINGDETISDDEVVDLVNITKKKELPGNYKDLSSFLTGVFLYVIKYVKNNETNNYVKEIDQLYIAEFINKNQHNAIESSIAGTLHEEEELKARQFIITHEKEKSLIPLCQIVYAYNPSHNYERSMFTEYNLLPKSIRKQILDQCDASELIIIDKLHWEEGLSLLCEDLRKYELSSERFIYMFGKYFPKFKYYPAHNIADYEIYSFKRIFTSEIISVFPGAALCSLDKYIDDYLWTRENKKDDNILKPMDYVFASKDFGNCPEEEVVFWICRFIIDACCNLSCYISNIDGPIDTNCFDDDAETIEDLSLCTLFALHKHYLYHNNDYTYT